jgi:hypothetical protein
LIHRRVWPALVRVADRFPAERLASVDEVHTASGAHRTIKTPFPEWIPAEDLAAARAAHYPRGARAAARLPSLTIDSFVTAARKSPRTAALMRRTSCETNTMPTASATPSQAQGHRRAVRLPNPYADGRRRVLYRRAGPCPPSLSIQTRHHRSPRGRGTAHGSR